MTLNPVAYYPLGDQDSFNGSNYLVPNSSLKDYVFSFDRNSSASGNDRIDISNFNYTGNKTVSFWINWDSNAEGCVLGHNTNGYYYPYIRYYNNYTHIWLKDSSSGVGQVQYSVSPDVGRWYHYCITGDGTTATVYIDGNSVGTTTDRNLDINQINAYNNILGNDCKLNNVQIFNTALPATGSNSVETLYNNGSPLTSMSGFTSLQGWWKLDASEIYDSSNTEWKINNAVSSYSNSLFIDNVFQNTSTNGITMGSYSDTAGLSAVSWSLWVNVQVLNSASGYSRILNSDSFSFATNASNGGLDWRSAFVTVNGTINNDFTLSTALQNQGWVNIIATYDGTNTKFYLNTVQQGTQGSGSGVLNTTSSLNLGYFYGSNSVDAYFSNFSIWNKALSTSDISEIYNSGNPSGLSSHSSTSNLINWWKLNNLSTGLQDSKGSSNASINGTSSLTTVQSGSVSTLNGTSSGMTQSALQQSDLSFKTSYSPYAFDFDSASSQRINVGTITLSSSWSISIWVNYTYAYSGKSAFGGSNGLLQYSPQTSSSGGLMMYPDDTTNNYFDVTPAINDGNWHNVVFSYDNSTTTLNTYTDGYLSDSRVNTASATNFQYIGFGFFYWLGKLSNCSIWNTNLSSAQVLEIYSEGVPQNLLNHSAVSSLVSWWQLGSNSSFSTNWTVLDEKGSNDGTSVNMTEDDIVDGVGSYANGLSSGMGGDEVIGDAPYSTSNSLSVNMDIEDRVSDTPS